MVNEKQFEKGEVITTVAAASIHILNDGWVYFNDRLMHPSWAANWSLAYLRQIIRARRLCYANHAGGDGATVPGARMYGEPLFRVEKVNPHSDIEVGGFWIRHVPRPRRNLDGTMSHGWSIPVLFVTDDLNDQDKFAETVARLLNESGLFEAQA